MEALHVQVRQIDGDLAVLLFNPREADLHVGETLTLHELATGRSVIVQVIAFRSATYPSLVADQMHNLVGPEPIQAPLLDAIGYQLRLPEALTEHDMALGNIKVALAKIRKTVQVSPSPDITAKNGLRVIGNNGTAGFPRARWKSFARPIMKCWPTPRATSAIGCGWAARWPGMTSSSKGRTWKRSTSSAASKAAANRICPKWCCCN